MTAIRNLFAPHYKFNQLGTPAAIRSNITLSADLLEEASFGYKVSSSVTALFPFDFSFQDVDARTGFAGNKILDNSRHVVLFKDKGSLGVVFASHFDPYPLPTLAVEFSTVCVRRSLDHFLIVHL